MKLSGGHFDLERLNEDITHLTERTLENGFYSDKKNTEKVFADINYKKYWVDKVKEIDNLHEEVDIYFEMSLENLTINDNSKESSENEETCKELNSCYSKLVTKIDEIELRGLLSKPEDKRDAIFTIHAGSGGTDSQDFAETMYRMYSRYFDKMGFKTQQVDYLPGDLVGIKTITIEVSGEYAYGYLKAETGVHRLIRLSPFDSQHKRHTSFVSVAVIPEADDIEISLDMNDVRVDTYRASGAGGQHVNKTDSAVRLTHRPSGIVVQSQAQRSQMLNKEFATKVLKAKLYEQKLEEEKKKMSKIEGDKMEISWGSQIRTYTFHPYSLVKDHRTNIETGNINAVMDGDLEKFVKGYLLKFIGK